MAQIRTLIVDDDKENLFLLNHLLNKHCPSVKVIGEAQNITEAINILEEVKPDLILLDIQLSKKETGFDLIKKINSRGKKPHVIFITAYNQYAIDAIKIQAFDYILKPVSIKELKNAINRLEMEFENNQALSENSFSTKTTNINTASDFITISHSDNLQVIKCSNIIYLEASGKYTVLHCKNETKSISSKNLGHYDEILNNNFLRIHHSYIVNIESLKRIEKSYNWYCLLLNGIRIPISRRKRIEIAKAFETS